MSDQTIVEVLKSSFESGPDPWLRWLAKTMDLESFEAIDVSLDAFVRRLWRAAETTYKAAARLDHPPDPIIGMTWITVDQGGKGLVAMTPISNEQTMAQVAEMMRTKFQKRDTVRYVAICEIWIGTGVGRPSQDPDRIEAVQIVAEDISGDTLIGFREIIRPSGASPYLGKLTVDRSAASPLRGLLNIDKLGAGAAPRLN